ncbi:MAG: alpha/beta hydrolase-fold protein [Flavobacteriaceae bacterium]
MLWKLIYIVVLLLIQFVCNSQNRPLVIGAQIELSSHILNEKREIYVYLPESYHLNSDKRYITLYIMDGQRYFLNAIAYQQSLSWQNKAPEFIVVGIKTDNQKRRELLYVDEQKFINFLKHDLVTYVDGHYRTSKQRFYFGWEMAAGIMPSILRMYPDLFQGYLLASPTHLTEPRLVKASEALNNKDTAYFGYATLADVEVWSVAPMRQLDSIFRSNKGANVMWKYDLVKNENHHSTPLRTINEGLNFYFKDYGPIRFYNLKEFEEFGGLRALYRFYHQRGRKYGILGDVHEDTKHFLFLEAWREDNVKQFKAFDGEFGLHNFLSGRYNNPVLYSRYGSFYLAHGMYQQALQLFRKGLEGHPNNLGLHEKMAKTYLVLGERKKAKEHLKKVSALKE